MKFVETSSENDRSNNFISRIILWYRLGTLQKKLHNRCPLVNHIEIALITFPAFSAMPSSCRAYVRTRTRLLLCVRSPQTYCVGTSAERQRWARTEPPGRPRRLPTFVHCFSSRRLVLDSVPRAVVTSKGCRPG